MKKSLVNLFFVLGVSIILLSGCNSTQSASANNRIFATPEPTARVSPTVAPIVYNNVNHSDTVDRDGDVGEIKSCSPEKIYHGETLTASLKTPHGIYSAIRRGKDNKWFFLYGGKGNEPAWNDNSFTKLSEITINTETAYNSTNVDVGETPEKIFTKTGKYRLMVSHEDFGQDDPPWTGMCEVYFVNKKRPQGK